MTTKYKNQGLLMVLGIALLSTIQAQTKKPNIILIMVDDMGYSDLGAYGSEIQTPNIDKLAYEGLRLREFYNNSICAPTRASLITGQYPHKAGVGYFDVNLGIPPYQGFLNKESLTFGEVLRQAGYSTLLSGKWHVGNDSLHWPKQRGFDRFFGVIGGGSNYFDAEPMPLGRKYPVVILEDNQRQKPKANSYYFTDEITNHAVQFLDEQNKVDKPFSSTSPILRPIGHCKLYLKTLPNTGANTTQAGMPCARNAWPNRSNWASSPRPRPMPPPAAMWKCPIGTA